MPTNDISDRAASTTLRNIVDLCDRPADSIELLRWRVEGVRDLASRRSLVAVVALCDMPASDFDELRRLVERIRRVAIEAAEQLEGLPPI